MSYHAQLIEQPAQRLRTGQHLHNDLTDGFKYGVIVDGRQVKVDGLDLNARGLQHLQRLRPRLYYHVLPRLLVKHVAFGFVQEHVEAALRIVVLDVGGDV